MPVARSVETTAEKTEVRVKLFDTCGEGFPLPVWQGPVAVCSTWRGHGGMQYERAAELTTDEEFSMMRTTEQNERWHVLRR